MAESGLITVDQPQAWNDVLGRCGQYDSYHLPGYHLVSEEQGEGRPYLFFFEDDGRCAALPFVLRSVSEVRGLEDCPHCDAASVYGYPGLVTSAGRHDPGAEPFRSRFQAALRETLKGLDVVALFVRQNPLIDSSWLFPSTAATTPLGPTVAIDLKQPEEDQLREIRRAHRYHIRRARKLGMVVNEDPDCRRIDTFVRLYKETMDRVEASDYYYFSKEYFRSLKRHLGDRVKLLFSEQDGRVIAGAMFLLTGSIIQFHLGGTATDCLRYRAGTKIIFDRMRSWGTQHGFSWLHLGGGLAARRDSLFDFKAGFSKTHLQFRTARLVFHPETYNDLVWQRRKWIRDQGHDAPTGEYFPIYRQPPVRRAA